MKLYHVVAMAKNRVIGKDNKLPWHFSSDLKHFKQLTLGHTVIMGRKTFESIGKPLPGRTNFILSRNATACHPEPAIDLAAGEGSQRFFPPANGRTRRRLAGAPLRMITKRLHFFSSLDAALRSVPAEKCFIIGGAEIYRQTLDKINGIYLTLIHQDYEGDAFYPEIPKSFKEISRELLQENPKIEVIYYENQ